MQDLSPAEYNRHYNNGWRASQSNGSYPENKTNAYIDGYNDYATGAPKWHRRYCPFHRNYNGPKRCDWA